MYARLRTRKIARRSSFVIYALRTPPNTFYFFLYALRTPSGHTYFFCTFSLRTTHDQNLPRAAGAIWFLRKPLNLRNLKIARLSTFVVYALRTPEKHFTFFFTHYAPPLDIHTFVSSLQSSRDVRASIGAYGGGTDAYERLFLGDPLFQQFLKRIRLMPHIS